MPNFVRLIVPKRECIKNYVNERFWKKIIKRNNKIVLKHGILSAQHTEIQNK
jgi:hypothetical protein